MSRTSGSALMNFTNDRAFEPTGSPYSRRLGARAATTFSVFVTVHDQRVRVRAAQLSTSGIVLDLRHTDLEKHTGNFTLELAVPGLRRPIRCVARLVRQVGKLAAFEFLIIGRDDRLTIAEHIDRVGRAWGW